MIIEGHGCGVHMISSIVSRRSSLGMELVNEFESNALQASQTGSKQRMLRHETDVSESTHESRNFIRA